MPHIKIDIINNGDVIEKSEDRPVPNVPKHDREIREIPDLQIVEIEQIPEPDGGFPAWRIPEILEIIEKNRGDIQKKLPDFPV